MGLVKKNGIDSYWNVRNYSQDTTMYCRVLTKTTFQNIIRILHASDSDLEPKRGTDNLISIILHTSSDRTYMSIPLHEKMIEKNICKRNRTCQPKRIATYDKQEANYHECSCSSTQ